MEFTIEEYNEEPQNTINASEKTEYQEPIQNTEQNVFEEVLLCKPVTIVKKCEHGKQKHRCRDCGGSSFCEHNKRKTYCETCGGSELCIHKKRKARCRECNGTEICIHKKSKYICRECSDGSAYCEHKKNKRFCKECGGSAYCEHKKLKYRCRDCDGSAYCEHKKIKSRCVECNGNGICIHKKRKDQCIKCGNCLCIHNKRKENCKECHGSQICLHNNFRTYCRECNGSALCEHGKKITCKICVGSACCEHGKIKYNCRECFGSCFCEHGKQKSRCKACGGKSLCKTPLCETRARKNCEGLCARCFVYTHPDKPNARNYKTKERTVVDIVLAAFPSFTWVTDKKVQDGCSRRRPDLFLDMGSHVIIVEVDENQHTEYDCSCENKRLMEISQDVGHRPIIFIRFNPDDYTDQSGTKVKSCFAADKSGIFKVAKSKVADWNMRTNALLQQIAYWSETPTTKTVEVVQLFYDS